MSEVEIASVALSIYNVLKMIPNHTAPASDVEHMLREAWDEEFSTEDFDAAVAHLCGLDVVEDAGGSLSARHRDAHGKARALSRNFDTDPRRLVLH